VNAAATEKNLNDTKKAKKWLETGLEREYAVHRSVSVQNATALCAAFRLQRVAV